MKSLIFFFFLIYNFAFADTKPAFSAYQIVSQNKAYIAKISCLNCPKRPAGDRIFKISVFDTKKKLKWETNFEHSGYKSGYLSNDGSIFVNISYWYYNDDSIFWAYRDGMLVKELKGKEIPFNRKKQIKTRSHILWLSKTPGRVSIKNDNMKPYVEITTIDDKKQLIILSP